MRVILANYGHFDHHTTPESVLDDFRTLTGWAAGLRDAGALPTVVQGFSRNEVVVRDGIEYRFVAGPFVPQLARWRLPGRLHAAAASARPDVIHLNGTVYALQAWDLRRRLPAASVLVVQHHAGGPSAPPWRWLQSWGLRAADGFFFTGLDTAEPWRSSGVVQPSQPVFEIMEGSSSFACTNREAARARSGLRGRPVCLWTGNLDRNKDPITVLDGLERALARLPEARLYMAYRSAELLAQVRERVRASAVLSGAVELLGEVPYQKMETLFNSADLFVQGSHREGSGYSLVDALACGVVPVVTAIPSFRYMTQEGAVGALWPPGDAEALAAAVVEVATAPISRQRQAARALFERRLSFSAIGRQAVGAYRQLRERRAAGGSGR